MLDLKARVTASNNARIKSQNQKKNQKRNQKVRTKNVLEVSVHSFAEPNKLKKPLWILENKLNKHMMPFKISL